MKYIPICALALIGLGASAITAQVIYNSASTAAEGAANGMSNIIAAQGQRNLSNSQAAINLTQARSSQIDNQVKSVNAFWEKKGIYERTRRAGACGDRPKAQLLPRQSRADFADARRVRSHDRHDLLAKGSGANAIQPLPVGARQTVQAAGIRRRTHRRRIHAGHRRQQTMAQRCSPRRQNVYPGPILSQMIRFILKVDRELDDNLG